MLQVLRETLHSLNQYTHIAFTSRNGIQAVLDALEATTSHSRAVGGILSGGGVRCCVLAADAELLQQAGVSNVLTPKEVGSTSKDFKSRFYSAKAPFPP